MIGAIIVTQVAPDELDYVRIDNSLMNAGISALDAAERRGLKVVVAESCTGGLIASVLSEAPGAAGYFEGGFVVYTPDQKRKALGVDANLIETCGTVSAEVTKALADGALSRSGADIAIAVTGVAGPDTDEKGNPVGLIYVSGARTGMKTSCLRRNLGDIGRSAIRRAAAESALDLLVRLATRTPEQRGR